jgi:hypothetical protein
VEDYYLLQPWPKEESRLTACIRPFSLNVFIFPISYFNYLKKGYLTLFKVWMLFFFSVIAIIVFMALLTHYYHQWGTERKSKSFMNDIYDHTLYTMTIIAGQGKNDNVNSEMLNRSCFSQRESHICQSQYFTATSGRCVVPDDGRPGKRIYWHFNVLFNCSQAEADSQHAGRIGGQLRDENDG